MQIQPRTKVLSALFAAVAGALLLPSIVRAKDPYTIPVLTLDPTATVDESQVQTTPDKPDMPRLAPYVDYSGDFWERNRLSGYWGGWRQYYMNKGMRLDVSYTQVLQRNVAGGLTQTCETRGGLDINLQLDTTYMGLWPGGLFKLKAEGGWGRSDNRQTGALMPVDTSGLYPQPGQDSVLLLPEINYTQFLAPFFGVTFGKYEPRETNVFARDETEQFFNAAFNFNPIIGTILPLSFLGAGIILLPHKDVMSTTMFLDSEGVADESGFDTVFKGGTSFMQNFDWTVRPFDLPGHQRVTFLYTDKVRSQLDQSPRQILGALITGSTAGLAKRSGDWAVTYDFDQYLWLVPGTKDRGIGIFGRYGYSDGNVNPIAGFYSVGLSANGICDARKYDSFGIAYYYVSLSSDLPGVVKNRTRDEQGVEIYYNIALTRWAHLTPDIQIISPANDSVDTTVVVGMRLKIDF